MIPSMTGSFIGLNMKVDYTKPMDLDFIEEFWDDLDMNQVVQYQKLPQDFIEKHFHRLEPNALVRYQKMTMNFIKEKWSELSIAAIATYQIIEDSVRDLLGLQPPAKTITGAQILALDPCEDGMVRYHAHTPNDSTVLTWNQLLELHNTSKDGQRDIHWLSWKLGKKINT